MVFMYRAILPKIASLASKESLAYQIRIQHLLFVKPMLTAFRILTVSMMAFFFFLNEHTISSELLCLNECFLISNSWKCCI